jgi:hypothetical protein
MFPNYFKLSEEPFAVTRHRVLFLAGQHRKAMASLPMGRPEIEVS